MADDAAPSAADSSAYQSVEKGEEKFPSAPPGLSRQSDERRWASGCAIFSSSTEGEQIVLVDLPSGDRTSSQSA